jgi:hypothetical protein
MGIQALRKRRNDVMPLSRPYLFICLVFDTWCSCDLWTLSCMSWQVSPWKLSCNCRDIFGCFLVCLSTKYILRIVTFNKTPSVIYERCYLLISAKLADRFDALGRNSFLFTRVCLQCRFQSRSPSMNVFSKPLTCWRRSWSMIKFNGSVDQYIDWYLVIFVSCNF